MGPALPWRLLGRAGTEGRADDAESVIRHRLEVYHEQTEPLLEYYDRRGILHRVDARGTPDQTHRKILEIVSRKLGLVNSRSRPGHKDDDAFLRLSR